ncbi:MAG: helix-turn-helix transcriptional regulator [Clostridium sp.]|nr:helix-turn-helix transcriptional regulator [Clostridium sp.]
MDILSPGKKIKRIRKDLKISQKEIAGGLVTRELISIIENDKSTLTPTVAKIITDNINKICKERNIDFNVDTDYLLEDINSQANKIASNYIDFLCNNENNISKDFSKDINEIELFLRKYDLPDKKTIIYEKIGDILRHQKKFNSCYIYYIKAFENYNNMINDIRVFKLLVNLGNVCLYLCRDKEALNFNNLALIYNNNVDESLKYKVFFNNTLAYMHLREHDKALLEIDHILSTFKTLGNEKIFELNILKVNCLRYKKFYKEALVINESMLDNLNISDAENIMLVVTNILDIYTVIKDTKNTKIYLDKLLYLINNYKNADESYHSPNDYNQIGLSATLINKLDLATKYYKKSIYVSKVQKNLRILLLSLDQLLDILIKEKNIEEINSFKNEIIELLSLDIISSNISPIFKLMNFYNEIEDRESLRSLLEFILEHNSKG